MQLFDPKNPNEKKKMIAAGVLALVALIVLGYVFFGGSSKKPTNKNVATSTPTPVRGGNGPEPPPEDPSLYQEIVYTGTVPAVSEADRNIFSYYQPPTTPIKQGPTPTPVPPPPLTLSALSPSSVFARTGEFSLQVMGDKFTPAVKIVIDGRVMPTRFINSQQLATTVSADMITNPGNRQIIVKSGDGSLYSNNTNFSVTPPPVPNYNYVGLIGKPRFNDIAVLQDKSSRELLNVQRGDVVGGRFRVNSISPKEVVVIDTTLKISHKVAFTESAGPQSRPPGRRPVDDDP